MNWQKITVRQYQQLFPLVTDDSLTNLDRLVSIISILEGIPEDIIDGWEYHRILDKGREYAFLDALEFDKTAKRYIDTPQRRYEFVWNVERMPAARYIEAKTYGSGNIIPNLHMVIASCVKPMRKNWYGRWAAEAYDARRHSEYASDLLDASFVDVYNCCVFFWDVLNEWMTSSLPSFLNSLQSKMPDPTSAAALREITDGFSQLNKLQSSSASA